MRHIGIPTVWFQDLSEDHKKSFEDTLRNSTLVLTKLRQILISRLESIDSSELREDFYELPNLAERLAYNRGQKRNIQDQLNLLAFIP